MATMLKEVRPEPMTTKQIGESWHVCDEHGEFDGPYETEWDAMRAIKCIAEPWRNWNGEAVH